MSASTFCSKCGAVGTGREGKMHSRCTETIPGTWETATTLVHWLRSTRTNLNESEAQRHAQALDVRAADKRAADLRLALDAAQQRAKERELSMAELLECAQRVTKFVRRLDDGEEGFEALQSLGLDAELVELRDDIAAVEDWDAFEGEQPAPERAVRP